MLLAAHVRQFWIIPALAPLPIVMRSPAAVELLLGTAIVESRLTFLRQGLDVPGDGLGEALGVFQIEPRSHADCWDSYLIFRLDLAQAVGGRKPDEALILDLGYATRIARIIYWRSPLRLPDVGDVEGLARVWKQAYNTPAGAGKPDEFVALYRRYGLATFWERKN